MLAHKVLIIVVLIGISCGLALLLPQAVGAGVPDTPESPGNSSYARTAAAAVQSDPLCYARLSGGTVYSSTDAAAVQQAVDAAGAGATVQLAGTCAGVQLRSGSPQTVYVDKALTLQGGFTVTDWLVSYPLTRPTVLDAQAGGRVVYATAAVSLAGLSVQNGMIFGGNGGAVYAAGSLTLDSVAVLSSTASNSGGGASVAGTASISGSHFQSNRALVDNGGGLLAQSTLILTDTSFVGNTAQRWGGGVIAYEAANISGGRFESNHAVTGGGGGVEAERNLTLHGAQFIGNRAPEGGGVYLYVGPSFNAANLLFVANTADSGRGAAIYVDQSNATLRHITIASPVLSAETAVYDQSGFVDSSNLIISNYTQGFYRGSGWLGEDYNLFSGVLVPCTGCDSGGHSFSGDPGFVDPAGGDYHLTASSDAVNRGAYTDQSSDLDGNPRPQGCGYDIGAYEYQNAPPGCTLTIGVDGNGSVTPTAGAHLYPYYAVVPVTATATAPWGFAGWSGDASGSREAIEVFMDGDKAITATFDVATCYATPDDGATVFARPNSFAVQQAVDAALAGGTVKVAGTCNGVQPAAYDPYAVHVGKNLTVEGGYTVTNWLVSYPLTQPTVFDAQGAGRVFMVEDEPATLSNLIVQNGYGDGVGGGIRAYEPLTLTHVTVISSSATGSGGGVYADSLVLVGGLFAHNVGGADDGYAYGGGLYVSSDLVLSGTQFISNTARGCSTSYGGSGGGAYVEGQAWLTGGRFEGNVALAGSDGGGRGGGLGGGSGLILTDTTFIRNTAAGAAGLGESDAARGGGLLADSSVVLRGGRFEGNAATHANSVGGGLYATNATLDASGTLFVDNTAETGGGAWVYDVATLDDSVFQGNRAQVGSGGGLLAQVGITASGGRFERNTAANSGGGLLSYGPLTLSGTHFLSNTASASGARARALGPLVENFGGGARALGPITVSGGLFQGNQAERGGGLYTSNGGTALSGATFSGNQAAYGGGLYVDNGSVTLTGVIFSGNQASYGGGLYNDVHDAQFGPQLANVLFSGNRASSYGGGMYDAASGLDSLSTPALVNVTFAGNHADTGGGALASSGLGSGSTASQPTLDNCIMWGNSAGDGTQLYSTGASTPTVRYSDLQGGCPAGAVCSDLIDVDPQFVLPIAGTAAPAGGGNYRLRQGSPAIDAGDETALPASADTDLDGLERIVGLTVDMGAYESQYEEICELSARTYSVGVVQPVTLTFDSLDDLGELSCLTVTYFPTSHPSATAPLQNGIFWSISGAARFGDPVSSGFTATLSLPYAQAGSTSSVCRYPGGLGGAGWDCGSSSYVDGVSVTRGPITAFSDWAVGDGASPTAVHVSRFGARRAAAWLPALAVAALAALLVTYGTYRAGRRPLRRQRM